MTRQRPDAFHSFQALAHLLRICTPFSITLRSFSPKRDEPLHTQVHIHKKLVALFLRSCYPLLCYSTTLPR